MPNRGARVRLWCEDREQEAFVRRLLEHLGVDRRALDVRVAPRGGGAASAWVFRQYQTAVVPTARKCRSQQRLGFLVVADGDDRGWEERARSYEGAAPRDDADRLALWFPTWSIETWVLWLAGEDVTETESLKARLPPERLRARLRSAVERWSVERPQESVRLPSLCAARREVERLPIG
jgi:hypothetical protein